MRITQAGIKLAVSTSVAWATLLVNVYYRRVVHHFVPALPRSGWACVSAASAASVHPPTSRKGDHTLLRFCQRSCLGTSGGHCHHLRPIDPRSVSVLCAGPKEPPSPRSFSFLTQPSTATKIQLRIGVRVDSLLFPLLLFSFPLPPWAFLVNQRRTSLGYFREGYRLTFLW